MYAPVRLAVISPLSPDFQKALACFKATRNLRQQRLQPREEDAVRAIPNAKPHDSGRVMLPETSLNEILVLRDHRPPAGHGKVPDASVVGIAQARLAHGSRRETPLAEPAGQRGRELGIHQETHGSGGHQDRVVHIPGGISNAGSDIFSFQVGEVREDFVWLCSSRQHVQHVLHPDAHAANAGFAAALVWIGRDSVHGGILLHRQRF
jgi:hypothetical protein